MNKPTAEGRARYPSTNGYFVLVGFDLDPGEPDRLPCTCNVACERPMCRGSCGCEACSLFWSIYADEAGITGP